MTEPVHEPTDAPAPHEGGFRTALRILSVRLRFIGLLVAVMVVTATWDDIVAHVERWTHTP